MEMNIYGLKCDNPSCDYQDDSIQLEQYEDYIDYPCPKCGSPLLTQADYDTTIAILKSVKLVENWSKGVDNSVDRNERYKITVQLDGTGIPKFDISEFEGDLN